MAIEFNCPHCDTFLKTPDERAGLTAKCPSCEEQIHIPYQAGSFYGGDDRSMDELDNFNQPEDDHDDASGLDSPTIDYEPEPAPQIETEPPQPQSTKRTKMKTCPSCGESINAIAIKCRYCGEELGMRSRYNRGGRLRPNRGVMILVFAIVGWLMCPIFSVVAWVMANDDLREIQAGRMDPDGESMVQGGKIIAMIYLAIIGFGILAFCFLMCMGAIF